MGHAPPRATDPDFGSAERLVIVGLVTGAMVVAVWTMVAWWLAPLVWALTTPLWVWAWRDFFRRERAGRHARALRSIARLERELVPVGAGGGMVLPGGMQVRSIPGLDGEAVEYVTFVDTPFEHPIPPPCPSDSVRSARPVSRFGKPQR